MMRPAVTLFGHWICPYSVRVEFALAQREIDYTLIDVPPTAARPVAYVVPSEFLDNSPRGEIPLLRIGDQYRADSIPILHWLEDEFASYPLRPRDVVGRAVVDDRVAWLDAELYSAMIGVYYGTDPTRIAAASLAMQKALETMASWCSSNAFLAGDEPTLADVIAISTYVRLPALRQLGFDGEIPKEIERHIEACARLEGWSAVSWSDQQCEELVSRFSTYRRRHLRDGAPRVE